MKKTFLLLAASMIGLAPLQAQRYCDNGYRGFIDVGKTIGIGDIEMDRYEVNTIHGYQINPYLFLGAGLGLHFASSYRTTDDPVTLDQRDKKTDVPIFANLRCNLLNKRLTPFLDLRGGTYINNNGSLYWTVAAGARWGLNEKMALHFSVGYGQAKLEFETFDEFRKWGSLDYHTAPRKQHTEAVTVKLGFEF